MENLEKVTKAKNKTTSERAVIIVNYTPSCCIIGASCCTNNMQLGTSMEHLMIAERNLPLFKEHKEAKIIPLYSLDDSNVGSSNQLDGNTTPFNKSKIKSFESG